jgi:predicted kinase
MRPRQEKHCVLVIGPPGSGKTTLARNYANYALFDNDRLIEALWRELQFHPVVKQAARRMRDVGLEYMLRRGVAVIVTISGRTKAERAPFVRLARAHGYRVTIVRMALVASECLARCKADKARPKTTDWRAIIERWYRVFESVAVDECDEYAEVR